MYEAAQTNVTNTSTAGILAIVVVSVACLAFWLAAVALASRDPSVRHRRTPDMNRRTPDMNRRTPDMMGPVLGGTHVSDCGRSVAPNRDSAATFDDAEAEAILSADADATSGAARSAVPSQRVPGGAPVPSQPGAGQPRAGQPEAPAVPAQQTGDAGQPRRTGAGG